MIIMYCRARFLVIIIVDFLNGSVAERSKALVLGTSPKGRGFESHRCHWLFFANFFFICQYSHFSDVYRDDINNFETRSDMKLNVKPPKT